MSKGFFRNWEEKRCPNPLCDFRAYSKTFKGNICPKCSSPLEVV